MQDDGNPKLITAGLVQWEIWDILDTDAFQQHHSVQGHLCVSEQEGSYLRVHGGHKQRPIPFEILAVGLLPEVGKREGDRKRKKELGAGLVVA